MTNKTSYEPDAGSRPNISDLQLATIFGRRKKVLDKIVRVRWIETALTHDPNTMLHSQALLCIPLAQKIKTTSKNSHIHLCRVGWEFVDLVKFKYLTGRQAKGN